MLGRRRFLRFTMLINETPVICGKGVGTEWHPRVPVSALMKMASLRRIIC